MVGEITDEQRSPHWYESGHRCGSHDSTSGTPVAGRPADAAAGAAPTMMGHAVEQREVIVVPANSGDPLSAGSGEGVSAPSNPVPNAEADSIGCSGKQPSSKWERES